ncbi:hypothetical protein QJS10_CPB17g00921 [Acorus calamus]|uniref:Importin N-terminal domain-containing protein n=1 Tax=Acorus calamus TaxID=4465 RepID=A0AAV9CY02_ACOCL|nr:hypothetical protein QJS10_CPB17g00921 [Acorus calamus]
METLIAEVSRLLNETLCPGKAEVSAATEALDRLSRLPDFPLSLLSIATGGESQGQRMAAATYLKNFTRRYMEGRSAGSDAHREFRHRLVQAALCAEPAVLKILVEALRFIVVADFVKENSWPELVPELKSVIQNSNLMRNGSNAQWKTINALTILQTTVKPFQKFDYPKERIVSLAFDVIAHVLKTGHDDMSEWTADFFTARKSAISLLGIISISKGSPVLMSGGSSSSVKRKKGDKRKGKQQYNSIAELLVIPFLSKFPIPSDATAVLSRTSQDYYGVLMAYGSLQDEMSADIYYSLLKALTMPDLGDVSCYPVRASAAGAVAELVQNGYVPPDWLPLLQVVIKRTTDEDGNESSLLYQLFCIIVEEGHEKVAPHSPAIVSTIASVISKFIPPIPEPWPQEVVTSTLPPPSCLDDASVVLEFIIQFVTEMDDVKQLKIAELLLVWADMISDWDAWEEVEDIAIFHCIQEAVHLHEKYALSSFFPRKGLASASSLPQGSIIEGFGAFISKAMSAYPSATLRACSCVHLLLHFPKFSFETECIKQTLAVAFTSAAFSRFKEIRDKPVAMWRPLLLVIASCYLCYPEYVEKTLEEDEEKGFMAWISGLTRDVHEETEQEFLDRYAQAANTIGCETVLEGDVEDEVQELELEWDGDAEEYIRKNLPSELDDMSEWTADFFTARKSAISLLGIISISKGSPVLMSGGSSSSVKRKKGDKRKGKQQYNSIAELLVIPFLSKFPIPSDATAVLSRTSQDYYGVLMAYGSLQDEMSADIYYSLLKALTMPDLGDVSCYPVRASAAGAVAELVQIVEWGFTALAKIAKVWEDVMPDEDEQNQSSNEYKSGWSTIARTFSGLLQQAWLRSPQAMEVVTSTLPPPSCLDDASVVLEFIIQFVTEMDDVKQLKIAELLLVWADMISDWDAWEEVEDIAIFHCIQEAVHLHEKYALSSFFPRKGSASASSLPQGSIIEGFGAFISKAMSAYPSAALRACSCVHLLLHFPKFSFETECIKQTLAVAFTSAAFSRFKEIRDKPVAMWRPLLLVIASCYLCYPEYVEKTLEEDEEKGFMAWISGLTRDVHEETEQELLDRYAQAANAIGCETVLEGDVEDEVQELELGTLVEVDPHEVVLSLIEKHHQLLLRGGVLPPQLKTGMLDAFPECDRFFKF